MSDRNDIEYRKTKPPFLEVEAVFSLRLAIMAARHINPQQDNPALRGLRIEPHSSGAGVLLIGANAHTLAVVYDERGSASDCATVDWRQVNWDCEEAAVKLTPHGNLSFFRDHTPAPFPRLMIHDNPIASVGPCRILQPYPEWRHLIPPGLPAGCPVTLSCEQLARFAGDIRLYGMPNDGRVLVLTRGEPMIGLVTERDNVFAVRSGQAAAEWKRGDWL